MEYSILDNTQPIHVIPAYASVEEHALFTIASAEESYNRIMESVGIYELSLVMEGNENKEKLSIKNVLEKFTKFVKELWQKFQDLVKTARDKFTAFVVSKVKALTEKKVKFDDVKAAITASKDERWNKDSVKNCVEIGQLSDTYASNAGKAIDEIAEKVKSAVKDGSVDDIDVEDIFANKFTGISKETFKDASKLKETIKNDIVKKEAQTSTKAKENAAKYFETYWNELTKAKDSFTKGIKGTYNKTKTNFDTAINDAKKVAKESDNAKAFKPLFRSASAALKVSACVINAIESAYYEEFRFKYSVVLNGLAVALVRGVKKESAAPEVDENKETTVATESSVFQTELASLFTF